MKKTRYLFLLIAVSLCLTGCFKDQDDTPSSTGDVKDFIYRAMNDLYLYKPEIPRLTNGFFATNEDFKADKALYESPETYFNSFIHEQGVVDRFSIITDDYIALLQAFQGTTVTNGMEFGLVRYPNNNSLIFGYVRYVNENTDAASKGISRGMIFNTIDGTQLNENNFRTLLAPDSYTIGLANWDTGNITPNGTSIALTKAPYTENPVFYTNVITQGVNKIGYLFYTGFVSDFDEQLNNAFGDFATQGITHLVLDVRYNGGGSVNTAVTLGSLIAGQPTSDVFNRYIYNPEQQALLEANNPSRLVNNFRNTTINGSGLNMLNLDNVHIITTGRSASASELIINALNPYIDVVQVGTNTTGKYQGSFFLLDSPNYSSNGVNPGHTYGLLPLVFKTANVDGFTDFVNGLTPTIEIAEDYGNLSQIGNVNEPLLEACLTDIAANGRPTYNTLELETVSGSEEMTPGAGVMYLEPNL